MSIKGSRRKPFQRMLAILTIAVMITGTLFTVPVQRSHATEKNMVGSFLVEFAAEWAMEKAVDLVERGIVTGLDAIIESSDGEEQVLSTITRIMKSAEENAIDEVIELCEEILEELAVIDEELANIEAQNQQLALDMDKLQINEITRTMDDFNSRYKLVVDEYEDLINAANEYAHNRTYDNYIKLGSAYDTIEAFSETKKVVNTSVEVNFINDIISYVNAISPYQASPTYQTQEQWKLKNADASQNVTYLSAIEKYYEDSSVSEAVMHEAISNNLNYSVLPLYYYLQAFQVYTLMNVNEINGDTTLSSTQKEIKIDNAWSDFNKGRNYAVNAINQMAYQYDDILTSYMRYYDTVPTRVSIDYKSSRYINLYREVAGDVTGYTTIANKTKDTMAFSILKSREDGGVYAALSDGGINPSFTLGDLACTASTGWQGTVHMPSADYYNMINGKGDSWGAMKLISSPAELDGIYEASSYALANSKFAGYIRNNEKLSGVFGNYTSSEFYGVTRTYDNYSSFTFGDADIGVYDLNNISTSHPDEHYNMIDVEDDVMEKNKSEVPCSFIMKKNSGGEIKLNFKVEASSDLDVKIENAKTSSSIAADSGNNYKVAAGTPMNFKVKVPEGKEIASAVLYGEDQNGEWIELETFKGADDTGNITDMREADSEGYIVLSTDPMPYRNAKLVVTSEAKTSGEQIAELKNDNRNQGRIEFSGIPGVDGKTVKAGTTVKIDVMPEAGYVATGIEIFERQADGKLGGTITIPTNEEASDGVVLPTTVKTYSFTMPERDIIIKPVFSEGHVITLQKDVEGGKLEFTDVNGKILDEGCRQRTYATGEKAYIKAVPTDSQYYYCESMKAVKSESERRIPITTTNFGGMIRMPDENVAVSAVFETKDTSNKKTVKVSTSPSRLSANIRINNTPGAEKPCTPGENVDITVIPVNGCWINGYSVKDADGEEISSTCMPVVQDGGVVQQISFNMPKKAVNVVVKLGSDSIVTHTGTIEVSNRLKASVIEKRSDEDDGNVILSDIADGSMQFTAKENCDYLIKVDKPSIHATPVVTLKKGNQETTLSPDSEDESIYRISSDSIDGNFTVKVENTQRFVEIGTADELKAAINNINENDSSYKKGYYLLTNDIDLTNVSGFVPINDFEGVFNGNGHTIKGMVINDQNAKGNSVSGFICSLKKDGCIKNIKFENCNVERPGTSTNHANCAVVAGYVSDRTQVVNCEVISSSIDGDNAGGIAYSVSSDATIRNCGVIDTRVETSAVVHVGEGNDGCAGGIVAYQYGTVENSFFNGELHGGSTAYRGGGISAYYEERYNGKIWNCYVLGDPYANSHYFREAARFYISPNTSNASKTYAIRDSESDTTVEAMKTDEFKNTLNSNISSDIAANSSDYAQWVRNDDTNDGAPCFTLAPMSYNVTVADDLPEGLTITATPNTNVRMNSSVTLDISTTDDDSTKKYWIIVKEYTEDTAEGFTVKKSIWKKGDADLDFTMPDENVIVRAKVYEQEVIPTTVNVVASVVPEGKANAAIYNAGGSQITQAETSDTVYLKLNDIAEGSHVERILLYANNRYTPYKIIREPAESADGKGYAIDLTNDSGTQENVDYKKVRIVAYIAQEALSIGTDVSPEGAGTVDITEVNGAPVDTEATVDDGVQKAFEGDEVTVSIAPNDDYNIGIVQLCERNADGSAGEVIGEIGLNTNKDNNLATGTFTMPAKSVVVKASFKKKEYKIETKDSENVKLSVSAGDKNVSYAAKGTEVTVKYTKKPYTANENIFVYKLSSGGVPEGEAIASKVASQNSGELKFTMPAYDVIALAAPINTQYDIKTEVTGSGKVFVADVITKDKSKAKAGETIFVTAAAERGWSLNMDETKVVNTDGNQVSNLENLNKTDKYATFSMPEKDITVKAVFDQKEYTISEGNVGGNSIAVYNGASESPMNIANEKVHYKDNLKIVVTPGDGQVPEYINYEASGKPVNIPLTKEGDKYVAEISMPDENITINVGYHLDKDEETNTYSIYTFEDLKQASKIVQTEQSANFRLMNNICGAGTDEEGNAVTRKITQSIGSSEKPYTGTFDGQGYYIFDFNIEKQDGDAALFGNIGNGGVVKRLGVFYNHVTGNKAAGIAVVNSGTIDECVSGSNVTGTFHDRKTGERRDLAEINTFVTGGQMAGGIVVENNGAIVNTRNYSKVVTNEANGIVGGIAAVNNGTIENSFNRGNLQANAAGGIAGGIAGKNAENGKINIAYCASTVLEASAKDGAIYGENANTSAGAVANTFFHEDLNGLTQGQAMTSQEMKNDAFRDTLNEGVNEANNDSLRPWIRNTDKNAGYPVISLSTMIEKTLECSYPNISVTGKMHMGSMLKYKPLNSEDDAYDQFKKYAKSRNLRLMLAGEPIVYLADGEDAGYEGKLKFRVNLSDLPKKQRLLLIRDDGTIEEVKPQNGIVEFESDSIPKFAFVSDLPKQDDGSGGITDKIDNAVDFIKTGDDSNIFIWIVVLIIAVAGVVGSLVFRRKKDK